MLKDRIDRLRHSTTLHQTATLSVGTAGAQLTSVLVSLLLARLYTPAEFGEMGVFSNCAAILLILTTGGYEYAIVRSRDRAEAANLFALTGTVATAFALLLAALFLAADLCGLSRLVPIPYKYMLPLYLLSAALLQMLNYLSNYTEDYRRIATSGISRSLTQAFFRIVLSYVPKTNGLISGSILGNVGACLSYWPKRHAIARALRQHATRSAMARAARRYANFPRYQLPSALLNSASTSLPVLFFANFYGNEKTGFLTMTIAILYLPISFVSNSVGQVFYKKAAAQPTQSARTFAKNLLAFSGIAAALIFTALVLWPGGERLFSLLLGPEWETAGRYAARLCPWLILTLCFSPISFIFDAKDRQKTEMHLNLFLFLTRIGVMLVGGFFLADEHTVALYGLAGALLTATMGYIILRILETRPRVRRLLAALVGLMLLLWYLCL